MEILALVTVVVQILTAILLTVHHRLQAAIPLDAEVLAAAVAVAAAILATMQTTWML